MSTARFEIRLAGSGGQGIILASVILAEAAGVMNGHQVCQSQSYGPEARGGRCQAEVVISDSPIDYPHATRLDMLVALNQEACDSYFHDFKVDGLLLVDEDLVTQTPTNRVIRLPFTRIARELTGKEQSANMAALGAIGHLCPMVTIANLEAAITARVPAKSQQMNLAAFRAGLAAAKKVAIDTLPRSITPEEEEI